MSGSNDGLPMLPPWLADTEVTGVGQTNFRNYEPPPVENLPQDEFIPETPEPANGFFNRRGRGDDRSDSEGDKKKGKGWFRNKNKPEPSLEERVGELLPNNNGPRPSQRNNWAEGTAQWSTQQVPQPSTDPHTADGPTQPGPSPDAFPQAGPSAPPAQHPPVAPPTIPGPPEQAPLTQAPDGQPAWGSGPQWGPGGQQPPNGTGLPPAPPPQQQFAAAAPPADTPAPPQAPGPDRPSTSAADSGFGASAAPTDFQAPESDRTGLPVRNPSQPAPEFDRLRPHHPIPPHPAPSDDSASTPTQNRSAGAPTTGAGDFRPPPPPLPDPPPTGDTPVAQQPLRRLPDLPPPPDTESAQTDMAAEAPVDLPVTPGPQQPYSPDGAPTAPSSGAHPIADQPDSADSGSVPHGSGASSVSSRAVPPHSAPGPHGSGTHPIANQPEQAHGTPSPHGSGAHPIANRPDSAGDGSAPEFGPRSSGAPVSDNYPAGQFAQAPESPPVVDHSSAPTPATDAPQWQAPESAPAPRPLNAPGPQWQAPEQSTNWPSGAQHSIPQQPGPASAPPGMPAQHGGPPTGHPAPGPHQQPNQPPAQQWQNQAPPADPGPPQQAGPGAWQQQGPQGGQWQNPQTPQNPPQQFGPNGPALDNVSVRRAKKPAGSGWRKVVHHASGGKINPGMSAEERRMLELVARIRQPVRGDYRIAVLSLKGGVGKTTTTIGLGSTFASIRGDRVIAVDANPDFGTLSQRVPLQTRSTVRDLLLDPAIQRYSDVRRHTSQATSRLEVLASERDPAASEAFNEDEYRAVARILQRFYNIILTDCGTGLMHSAMAGVLQLAHSLVLISPTAIDGAQSASATLDWLSLHGYHHLVQNAVVVINSPRDGTPNIDVQQLRQYFLSRCRAVHMIPFDPHMSEGAEIDLPRLKKETKRAYVELAATVADDFGRSYGPHHAG
ncbi:MinD/ParA family ATP-binding protein [Nocardia carnea]|uniref:AAA family ATPase n=1 Tax=Nocardia carnea TaxID=37328 RepID=A0ABW7TSK1_9NOCA|nr:MinD/ParA family protein [Nocardia carnea]